MSAELGGTPRARRWRQHRWEPFCRHQPRNLTRCPSPNGTGNRRRPTMWRSPAERRGWQREGTVNLTVNRGGSYIAAMAARSDPDRPYSSARSESSAPLRPDSQDASSPSKGSGAGTFRGLLPAHTTGSPRTSRIGAGPVGAAGQRVTVTHIRFANLASASRGQRHSATTDRHRMTTVPPTAGADQAGAGSRRYAQQFGSFCRCTPWHDATLWISTGHQS